MTPTSSQGTPCWPATPQPRDGSADPNPTPGTSPDAGPVSGTGQADVVVVGAGLAGLTTALHLLDAAPGIQLAVVDAAEPASGASGRGTGLLGPRAGPAIQTAVRRYGAATARRMHLASTEAVRQATELCHRLGVETGPPGGEQLVVARGARGLAELSRQAPVWRQLGLDVPVLSASAIRERFDIPCHAGLLHPAAATVDPAALCAALTADITARGAQLYTRSALRAVRPAGTGGGVELTFPEGVLRTRKAVLALGADAGSLGLPLGGIIPVQVHALATEPLPPEARRALGDGRAALVEAPSPAPYLRLTQEGQLVLGGGALFPAGLTPNSADTARREVWEWLEHHLRGLHPTLRSARITHRWAGRIGMTRDDLPVVGRVRNLPDVWHISGCCGHGLALSVLHGAHVANRLLERDTGEPPLPWHRDRAPAVPLGRPARPLVRAYVRSVDRAVRATPVC